MRIINAVGPATSSVSPSFPTTRVDRSPLFPTLLAPRPIRFPVNKHFPFGSLFFSLSLHERPPPQSNRPDESFPYSTSLSFALFFFPPLSLSLISFFSFSFSSLLFLLFISAARGFLEFRTAFQRTPPDHRPLSISCSGTQTRSCGPPFLDQSTVQPWGIRGPRPSPRLPPASRNRVCKTLFLDEFKRNGTSRKLRR